MTSTPSTERGPRAPLPAVVSAVPVPTLPATATRYGWAWLYPESGALSVGYLYPSEGEARQYDPRQVSHPTAAGDEQIRAVLLRVDVPLDELRTLEEDTTP